MNILILNGSPRTGGNTKAALTAIQKGMADNIPQASIEVIDVSKAKLRACVNCDVCKENGGTCVLPADNAAIIQKITDADCIIFGTPVYWWGVSAHLKMAMDSMYSRAEHLSTLPKKVGLVVVGQAELDDPQYRIIREQFENICGYLNWTLAFSESMSTPEIDSIAKDTAICTHLEKKWEQIAR